MIEITHQQARRMLRQIEDGGRLPDAQWALLQAHLEGCPACRAYGERRQALARGLGAALRERWSGVGYAEGRMAEPRGLAQRLVEQRTRRARILRIASRAALGLALFAAALLFIRYRPALAPAPTPTVAPTAPAAAAADPDLAKDTFRGLLVYSALGEGGDAEIFLLNRREAGEDGAEITVLAPHPAQDVAPVWSPDGEWIAFLSNRAPDGGVRDHYELFAVSVAGTRLTQLTDLPDVDWQGPISWSADGALIALTGLRRNASSRPYVYLVPLDAKWLDGHSAPRALAYTTGSPGPLRFSPSTSQLAYAGPQPFGGLILYHLRNRTYYALAPPEQGRAQAYAPAGGAFDWTADGLDLVYLSQGLPDVAGTAGLETRLWATRQLNLSASSGDTTPFNLQVDYASGRDGLRGAAAAPGEQRVVASLTNPGGPGCWKVKLYTPDEQTSPRIIDGFCVEGDLRHENWSADGRWLILTGRPQFAAARPGLYAVRIPQPGDPPGADFFARIAEGAPLAPEPGLLIAPEWSLAQPSVRPAPVLGLDIPIRVAEPRPPAPAPVPLPASAPGVILYEARSAEGGSAIIRLDPGTGERVLIASPALTESCPTLAPDGRRFAYLENSLRTSGVPAVMITSLDGETSRHATASARPDGAGGLEMSCPVWSPDGKYLAWIVFRPQESFLKVIAVEESADGTGGTVADGTVADALLRLSAPSYLTPPVWTPDGAALLYGVARSDIFSASIVALPLAMIFPERETPALAGPTLDLIDHLLAMPPRMNNNLYDDVLRMDTSADGRLSFIQIGWMNEGTTDLYELNPGGEVKRLAGLPSSKLSPYRGGPTLLRYLHDGSLIYATRHEVDALYKSVLWLYDRAEGQSRPLVYLEDMLYDAALSPDERWLAYSTHAGLFVLDLAAAKTRAVTPYLLVAEPVWDVDWE